MSTKKNRMPESEPYSTFYEEDWDHIFTIPPSDSVSHQYAQLDLCLESAEWSYWNSVQTRTHHPMLSYDEVEALDELLPHESSQKISLDFEGALPAELLPNDGRAPTDPRSVIIDRQTDIAPVGPEFMVSESTQSNNSAGWPSLDPAPGRIGAEEHSPLEFMNCRTEDEYRGLRIVHLLVACAEATSKESRDLAEVTLCRLRELATPTGTTMERVAYYLLQYALQRRCRSAGGHMEADACNPNNYSQELVLGAFRLLHQAYPYIRIAHFTANQSILEALPANHSRMHIIDFDLMEGMQWPPLMEALVREDFEVRELRITAVKWGGEGNSSVQVCRDAGRRLGEYAESVGIAFSFEETELQNVKDIIWSEGAEAEDVVVVANCMWQLPHMCELRSKLQVLQFLLGVRRLQPVILTFATGAAAVEPTETGSRAGGTDFLSRFCHCLQSLCAVFDSLEAGLPRHGLARAMVERFFFGPKMCRLMMRSGDDVEEECDCVSDPRDVPLRMPLRCGFVEGVMSHENMLRANALLSLSCHVEGYYGLQFGGDHQLVLKWGSTPLVWVSSWETPS